MLYSTRRKSYCTPPTVPVGAERMPAQRAYTVVSTCCLYCTVELYLLYLYSTYYSPGGTS